MTEEHQNIERHYVTVNDTTNRIPGNLSMDSPAPGIKQVENGKYIPNHIEQKVQRANYITLVREFWLKIFPALNLDKMLLEALSTQIQQRSSTTNKFSKFII
jgi:hypothetical protein